MWTYLPGRRYTGILPRHVSSANPSDPLYGHNVWIIRQPQASGILAEKESGRRVIVLQTDNHGIARIKSSIIRERTANQDSGSVSFGTRRSALWCVIRRDLQDRRLPSRYGPQAATNSRIRATKVNGDYFSLRDYVRIESGGDRQTADDSVEMHDPHRSAGGIPGSLQGSPSRIAQGSSSKCSDIFSLFTGRRTRRKVSSKQLDTFFFCT